MALSILLDSILQLAEALDRGDLAEDELEARVTGLTGLDREGLEQLAVLSERASLRRPRSGWSIAAVAAAAVDQHPDPFVQALAFWYLARAANDYVRPRQVESAILRARQAFTALGEVGWVAACDWQLYALPWVCNDLNEAVAALARALDGLEQAGMDLFAPYCRLALAFAQILTGNFSAVAENITASEQKFQARGDLLNQARCWLTRSGLLRRQGDYPQAYLYLNRAAEAFEQLAADVDYAKTILSLAYCELWSAGHYQAAEMYCAKAIKIFRDSDISLWEAQSMGCLAQIYNNNGQLHKTRVMLKGAQEIYKRYDVLGLYADSLLDSGRLEIFWGHPSVSNEQFAKAEKLYATLGSTRMHAISVMYQGWALAQFACYQQALHYLEQAQQYFQVHNHPERLAECEIHLAQVWARLGYPTRAHQSLNRAAQLYRSTGQKDFQAFVFIRQAETYLNEDKGVESLNSLESALALSKELDDLSQIAVTDRLYGEILLALRRPADAIDHLNSATQAFNHMGMLIEQAACQVGFGEYYVQTSRIDAALDSWKLALQLSENIAPDVTWRAWAGLASLAEGRDNFPAALDAYRQMITALVRIRRDFLQPSLAGSYLRKMTGTLNQAVSLAAKKGAREDCLHFIEESKAQTLLPQLARGKTSRLGIDYSELEDIAAEIRWLSERLRGTSVGSGRLLTDDQSTLLQQLKGKNRAYDEQLSRLERQHLTEDATALVPGYGFDVALFSRLARSNLGEEWIALDYYMTETHLIGIAITSASIEVWQNSITSKVRLALDACAGACRLGQPPSQEDLEALGAFLIPQWIQKKLKPQTYLILAPHHQLHIIPWAALLIQEEQTRPLVIACIPVVVPSLYNLMLLWTRKIDRQPERQNGLILAVSEFQGRRRAIPAARTEAQALTRQLGTGSKSLLDQDATLKNMEDAASDGGLSRFAFWHIASHAFHDPITGRLSGIALHDDNLWLDRFWELAPLPQLVTLSACNGMQNLMFAGDEQIGLPTTCLAAGAEHVVGSLWPILDKSVVGLMVDFYEGWWMGFSPAMSLALAQRAAIRRTDGSLSDWAGFFCSGSPV